MENDSDTLNILSSDENQATYDSYLEENAIPLGIMMEVSNPRDDRAERNRGSAEVPLSTVIPKSKTTSEESTCSQADDKETTSARTADDNGLVLLSSSSSCCRICQNEDSSEQLLEESPCRCKGYLGKAHRKCLVEWVRYKGSNKCEICGAVFSDIPAPRHLGVNQIEALETLRWQMDRYRPFSRDRRSAMAGLIVFLGLVTFVSAILTVGADRDWRRVAHDPWASRSDQETTHVIFSICISFLFFTGTLTIGLTMLWLVLECYYATHRRRVIRRTAERMVAEGMRERRRAASQNARATTDSSNARGENDVTTSSRDSPETSGATRDESIRVEIPTGSSQERTEETFQSQQESNAGISNAITDESSC